MNAIVSEVELIRTPAGELFVTTPALPVRDWPSIRAQLPVEWQAYELAAFIPTRDGAGFRDGWVLTPPPN